MGNLMTLTDLGHGKIQISLKSESAPTEFLSCQVAFADPLSTEDRRELRWYLEEYLEFPFGAERDRARQVERNMEKWGEALFGQVFAETDSDLSPRFLYEESMKNGLSQCEICVASDDPVFLDIPWELLRDPTPGRGYLGPTLKGLYRQLSTPRSPNTKPDKAGEPFRILLVIARKKNDPISIRSDARMLIHALRPLGSKIHLEVLRPPTFDAFERRLNLQPGFFDLVHFDGHGAFLYAEEDEDASFSSGAGIGCLLFETFDGEPRLVTSHEIGQVLTNCRVPFFVLSACQSAEEGRKNPFSSVASQLIAAGASGVIGMSYSVHADAAEKFNLRFYESLVNHATLSEAVASARRSLFADQDRESLVGPVPLRDWTIPRLYLQTSGMVPIPNRESCNCGDSAAGTDTVIVDIDRLLPRGQYGFIGRDQEILQIERALRSDDAPWIMITGMGGVGKTDLAYGFGRWYWETGGCPGGVYLTSFKARGDFDHIIGSIARFGTDFYSQSDALQFEKVSRFLFNNPCLLIWDNLDTVSGHPAGAHSVATGDDRKKMSALLRSLRGGKTKVIITARNAEQNWLGIAPTLIEIEGLTMRAAAMLAKEILRTVGRQPREFRDDPSYGALIRLLMGHPRSVEVVVPLLRNRTPTQIIESLQHQIDNSRISVTDASLDYAFSQMSDSARKHLPVLGLFSSFVIVNSLEKFTQLSAELTAAYKGVMGNDSDNPPWENLLEEASSFGLLRSLGPRMYEIHPTLPIFLRQRLTARVGIENINKLNSCFTSIYGAIASDLSFRIQRRNPGAIRAAQLEEHNLLRALRIAVRTANWESAQYLAQALFLFYKDGGFYADSLGLIRTVLQQIGRKPPADATLDKVHLWMFLMSVASEQALDTANFSNAKDSHQAVIDYLLSLDDPAYDKDIAMGYGNLGIVAQEENQHDLAEELMGKALEILQRLNLDMQAEAASIYHGLATLATRKNRLQNAESLCVRSGSIFQRLGFHREAADSAVQLAVIKIKQGHFGEARDLCFQAASVFDRIGLGREAAQSYHNLGISLQDMHQLDGADEAFREAAIRFERLLLPRETAAVYHHLGINAQERKRFDLAEQWFKRAMEKLKPLRYAPLLVPMMTHLGSLCHDQNRFKEGIKWLARAFSISSDYKMEETGIIVLVLARFMRSMGRQNLVTAWREVCAERELPLEKIIVASEKANAESQFS